MHCWSVCRRIRRKAGEDIVNINTLTERTSCSACTCTVVGINTRMTELVVTSLFIGIGKNLISLVYFLEFFLAFFIAGMQIRVIFLAQALYAFLFHRRLRPFERQAPRSSLFCLPYYSHLCQNTEITQYCKPVIVLYSQKEPPYNSSFDYMLF